ncbi:hypothetical protein L596_016137 [Steinernema carpocapsae]|uniref:Uncharacterized protein n=1 Tax=Steinernema carpocapsae TaxID=34508 RepID=A0A4U5NHW8_STECR|nr:hypothetical protein L596_016137 [Steinernema carpocapsae]
MLQIHAIVQNGRDIGSSSRRSLPSRMKTLDRVKTASEALRTVFRASFPAQINLVCTPKSPIFSCEAPDFVFLGLSTVRLISDGKK